ncbi:tail fiber protein [uncultured Bradyrhizobium sp.]|uniref:tail fiber protein n=1 Tax=uncultured Bradyrhizobium sp. TaxID=199684 RepID=UPI0035CBE423
MALPFYNWSRTAASNATADSTVNWAEGQAPSSVNDSARAMMASTAAFRDDISGAIVTGGTSTAYTVSTYEVFPNFAALSGKIVAFTPHATNGPSPTVNVDGLGATPLRASPGVDLLPGVLIAGTPYVAICNTSDGSFYLQNFYGNPYNVPLAAGMDFWGSTAPNSAFAFPIGQAISRTTYSELFGRIGTTYGIGDGTTTFNLPDKRGRVSAALDPTGAILNAATVTNGNALGGIGGSQQSQLLVANLPPYTPAGSISNGAITISGGSSGRNVAGDFNNGGGGGGSFSAMSSTPLSLSASQGGSTFTGSAQGGTAAAFSNVQPTIICNYIIRVL